MKMIIPFAMSDAALVSSTVPAADPLATSSRGVWTSANSYALNDIVQVDSPTLTFTAAGATMTSANHCFPNGTIHRLSTTGTLPAGLSPNTNYYLVQVTLNTYKYSLQKDGPPIITTDAGTGTHTATASVHKLYQCLIATGAGGLDPRKLTSDYLPASTAPTWLDLGATNLWKAFDGSCTSQSELANGLTYVIQTSGRCNAIALLNAVCNDVTITARYAGNIVYGPTTYARSSRTTPLSGWWDFFFAPVTQKNNFVDYDLPSYADMEITITLSAPGSTAQVGAIVCGYPMVIGDTAFGSSVGIIDYSVKGTDAFGNKNVVQRAYSDRASFMVEMPVSATDGVKRILTKYRATPVVYDGSSLFDSTLVYGYFKDLNIVLSNAAKSTCTLEVDGLA